MSDVHDLLTCVSSESHKVTESRQQFQRAYHTLARGLRAYNGRGMSLAGDIWSGVRERPP
jgi:hypothetical protein